MVALLMFAAGFALGLFFGWLLHRERVERAVFEDVARNRDRATSALAETSARLELANKDMIRLRRQLTDAQRLLDEREATMADLDVQPSERVATAAVGDHDRGWSAGAGDVARGSGSPLAVDRSVIASADADEADDEAEITEEVALAAHDDRAAPPVDEAPPPTPAEQLMIAAPADDTVDRATPAAAGSSIVPDEDEAEAATAEGPPSASGEDRDVTVESVSAGTGAQPFDATASNADAKPIAELTEVVAPADDHVVAADGHVAPADDHVVPPDDHVTPATDTGAGVPGEDAGAAASRAAEVPDDLRQITGVGPALERALHAEGLTTFAQIAALDDPAIEDLQTRAPRLASRLRRGGWVAQARRLHAEAHGDAT